MEIQQIEIPNLSSECSVIRQSIRDPRTTRSILFWRQNPKGMLCNQNDLE